MTSPISNIEQLAGRVVREIPGKKNPIIIDMVDYGSFNISRTLHTRLKFYDRKEWPVQFIIIQNELMKKIDRDQVLQILKGDL